MIRDAQIGLRRLPAVPVFVLGVVTLLVSIVMAVTFGASDIAVKDVWDVLLHLLGLGPDPHLSERQTTLILEMRLPRTLLAAVAGAGLSLCGVIMQSLLRNPLADLYLLGVSSGASTGAVLVVLAGIGEIMAFPAGAFVGSLAAFGATLVSRWRVAPRTRSCWRVSPSRRGFRR